jgi:hypothetical protein
MLRREKNHRWLPNCGPGTDGTITQDGKLGNTGSKEDELDFGIQLGMPVSQPIGDDQQATGFIDKCSGDIFGWKYKVVHCNPSLFTNLSQVDKSWPLSQEHLS